MDLQDRINLPSYTPEQITAAQFFARTQLGGQIIAAEQVESALDTVEFIAKLPEGLHDQAVWAQIPYHGSLTSVQQAIDCGTACCFAGWHALLRGKTLYDLPFGSSGGVFVDAEGDVLVEDFVSGDLGLPTYDGNGSHPFATHNTLDDLRIWVLAMFIRYSDLRIAAGQEPLFTVAAEGEVHV